MAKLIIKDTEITIVQINDNDYISLTDMLRAKDGEFFISDWLRNRNTLSSSLSDLRSQRRGSLTVWS